MPVIVNATEQHPFLPSLGDPSAIASDRALHQDIRPLEIAILNLMADKQATERQLAHWLGRTPLQVRLTFIATDAYVEGIREGRLSRNTPSDHILKFYRGFSDIADLKFDGLIMTGVNALKSTVAEEDFWPDVKSILDWSTSNVLSSLFLCWGAKAGLLHFHGVESHKGDKKVFGLFSHHLKEDRTGIMFGFPDVFDVPVSRWKSPRREDVYKVKALEVLADSVEAGPNIIVEAAPYEAGKAHYAKRVYVLNHPEYETTTLKIEYDRDSAIHPNYPKPAHYFPGDDPLKAPVNSWRHTGNLYVNWIRNLYEATPYDKDLIPQPWQGASGSL